MDLGHFVPNFVLDLTGKTAVDLWSHYVLEVGSLCTLMLLFRRKVEKCFFFFFFFL